VAESADALEFREVTQERWPDLALLFEGRGGPSYCWCMAWRPGGSGDNASKRDALKRTVEQGTPIGLLAYEAAEPVAWCSIAPRESYRKLGGAAEPAGVVVCSVVCFYVQRRLRRQGVAARLLRAAVELARSHGADIVEGYPVDPDSPSYRFMGLRSTFATAGFEEVGRAGSRRYVARLSLRPAAADASRS
jgi:GNAT superfamily N-acetyltransferase